jgi:hypothetical protein
MQQKDSREIGVTVLKRILGVFAGPPKKVQ